MKKLLLFIIFIVVLGGGLLAYCGFLPSVSKIMGTDKPRNLGIKYDKTHYTAFLTKANVQVQVEKQQDKPKPSETLKFTGSKEINGSFSQEELSARINYSQWEYIPISDVQIRTSKSNELEIAGMLHFDRVEGFLSASGIARITIDKVRDALTKIENLGIRAPIYIKAQATVKNNEADIQVKQIALGKLSLPLEKVDIDKPLEALVNKIFGAVPGFYVNSATFEEGKMYFSGTAPTNITIFTN